MVPLKIFFLIVIHIKVELGDILLIIGMLALGPIRRRAVIYCYYFYLYPYLYPYLLSLSFIFCCLVLLNFQQSYSKLFGNQSHFHRWQICR